MGLATGESAPGQRASAMRGRRRGHAGQVCARAAPTDLNRSIGKVGLTCGISHVADAVDVRPIASKSRDELRERWRKARLRCA